MLLFLNSGVVPSKMKRTNQNTTKSENIQRLCVVQLVIWGGAYIALLCALHNITLHSFGVSTLSHSVFWVPWALNHDCVPYVDKRLHSSKVLVIVCHSSPSQTATRILNRVCTPTADSAEGRSESKRIKKAHVRRHITNAFVIMQSSWIGPQLYALTCCNSFFCMRHKLWHQRCMESVSKCNSADEKPVKNLEDNWESWAVNNRMWGGEVGSCRIQSPWVGMHSTMKSSVGKCRISESSLSVVHRMRCWLKNYIDI